MMNVDEPTLPIDKPVTLQQIATLLQIHRTTLWRRLKQEGYKRNRGLIYPKEAQMILELFGYLPPPPNPAQPKGKIST